ncbi:MAG: M6 family metalloprotease domain-containing protein [Prevotella sp.]|nr:M6 family metalloprotease domain-containing protein [Prevotella sp.]
MIYRLMKGLLGCLMVLTATAVCAQRRYDCMAALESPSATRGVLGYPQRQWDPGRTYRQPVVLIAFADCDFSMASPVAYYDRILNQPGYNEGAGPGCMADYFRDQSGGLFNMRFDVYGPVRIDESVKTGTSGASYGSGAVAKALKLLVDDTTADFSPYDWDGDGRVDQVICILAGYSGSVVDGYVWPNTGSTGVTISDRLRFSTYSLSCELWADGTSCGIGTICHEFSHCLGLPDIYPLSYAEDMPFSMVDEWDLMDGGNFTGRGWCPPNYSALERMLLGWHQPRELTGPESISALNPVDKGGESLLIRHPSNTDEYFLLENRQQSGWDYGLPGEGLLIAHVDYNRQVWSDNAVNSNRNRYRYDLVHADNRDYRSWDPANNGRDLGKYTMEGCLRNRYLSTSAYPWTSDSTGLTNSAFTDTSVPAAVWHTAKDDGSKQLHRPIIDIRLTVDGTVSFDFMKGASAVTAPVIPVNQPTEYYDLSGHRLPTKPQDGSIYIGKTTGKVWKGR